MDIRNCTQATQQRQNDTVFNALTGSNPFVGNWPGVTVEKKEGKLEEVFRRHHHHLPGIYSLSPYTMEEVVAVII